MSISGERGVLCSSRLDISTDTTGCEVWRRESMTLMNHCNLCLSQKMSRKARMSTKAFADLFRAVQVCTADYSCERTYN